MLVSLGRYILLRPLSQVLGILFRLHLCPNNWQWSDGVGRALICFLKRLIQLNLY